MSEADLHLNDDDDDDAPPRAQKMMMMMWMPIDLLTCGLSLSLCGE